MLNDCSIRTKGLCLGDSLRVTRVRVSSQLPSIVSLGFVFVTAAVLTAIFFGTAPLVWRTVPGT